MPHATGEELAGETAAAAAAEAVRRDAAAAAAAAEDEDTEETEDDEDVAEVAYVLLRGTKVRIVAAAKGSNPLRAIPDDLLLGPDVDDDDAKKEARALLFSSPPPNFASPSSHDFLPVRVGAVTVTPPTGARGKEEEGATPAEDGDDDARSWRPRGVENHNNAEDDDDDECDCDCCRLTIVVEEELEHGHEHEEPRSGEDEGVGPDDRRRRTPSRHAAGRIQYSSRSSEQGPSRIRRRLVPPPASRGRQQQRQQQPRYRLDWDRVVPFSGRQEDRRCSCRRNQQQQQQQQQQQGGEETRKRIHRGPLRSDAALLLGLLKSVQHVADVRSVFLQVHGLWEDDPERNGGSEDDDLRCSRTSNRCDDWECSLLVTLGFPHLFSSPAHELLSILPRPRHPVAPPTGNGRHQPLSASSSGSWPPNKPLDPAARLLLALCRSDWEALEHVVVRAPHESSSSTSSTSAPSTPPREPARACRCRRPRVPLFPPELAMGHLYRQLPSSIDTTYVYPCCGNSTAVASPREARTPAGATERCPLLLRLPREVLRNQVAAFLTAQELDAVRRTCQSLRHLLRDVVPGLRLKLYRHQISSLVWMRGRECPPPDDRQLAEDHGPASGGRTVLLRPRPPTLELPRLLANPSRAVRVDGAKTRPCEDAPQATPSVVPHRRRSVRICTTYGVEWNGPDATESGARGVVARGGLLCDDPGLGKTITVLALILQTYGISTKMEVGAGDDSPSSSASDPGSPRGGKAQDVDSVDEVFHPYWTERVTADFRRPLLTKLVNDLLRNHRGSSVIPVAYVKKIRANIEGDSYGSDFGSFERDVESAIAGCDSFSDQPSASLCLRSEFQELVRELKLSQLKSAKKSFSNTHGRHQSRAAAAVAKQAQEQYLSRLAPSCSTLIVIPNVLMEHWQTQILTNIDMNFVAGGKIPLVFEYGKHENDGMSVHKADKLCREHRTHMPLLFVDRGATRPLPSAEFLAMFRMVLSSTDRFKNEWSRGSFQSELRQADLALADKKPDYVLSLDSPEEACPLLKVNWLRLVVDEGHSMGKGQMSSTIQFASWITAHRRWAMTGTPTKHSASELNQVKGLLAFLKHDAFGLDSNGSNAWRAEITKPWHDGSMFAFFRLKELLSLFMKRHTKLDIAELPPPRFQRSLIPMSFIEATTYNTLVCGVQSNLLLTSMKGKTSGEMDSLLHRSQSKHAREALANVRRVCVGWSRVVPTLELKFFIETLHLLQASGINEKVIEGVRQYLIRAQDEQLTPCGCCGLQLSTPLLLSCCGGHLCPECMDGTSNTCLLCNEAFDVDEFQRLQPGFVLTWKSNVDISKTTKIQRTPVRAPTSDPVVGRHELAIEVERPPAVIRRPDEIRRRTRRLGDGHTCEYDVAAGDGICKLCNEPHDSCTLFNDNSRCPICHAVAQDCPDDESKASFLVSKLCGLLLGDRKRNVHALDPRALKVIVYSQFRQALNVVGDRLLKRFGPKCVAEYWGKFRVQELHKFITDADCFCMLLSNDGSEGLDLSFVTHIFFLEEIWDASLRDQAVARAWRMGAKGRVEVETLLAKNSVEETMQEIESSLQNGCEHDESPDSDLHAQGSLAEYQRAKTKNLLQSLRFILDYHGTGSKSCSMSSEAIHEEKVSPLRTSVSHLASPPPPQKRPLPRDETEPPPIDRISKRVRFEEPCAEV